MKRLHVHVSVDDLDRAIGFYSALFAAGPTVQKPDYAKWMLEDPRVNFAISQRGVAAGLDHLGIQVETDDELHDIQERLTRADGPVLNEGDVTCCYARSRKSWIQDPAGLSWEAFLSLGESAVYSDGDERKNAPTSRSVEVDTASACCVPEAQAAALAGQSACCGPGTTGSTEQAAAKACC